MEENPTLRGWDAICKRANVSKKTAMKLATFGQPNRMPVYKQLGVCVASQRELDQWLKDLTRPYGLEPFGSTSLHSSPRDAKKTLKNKRKAA